MRCTTVFSPLRLGTDDRNDDGANPSRNPSSVSEAFLVDAAGEPPAAAAVVDSDFAEIAVVDPGSAAAAAGVTESSEDSAMPLSHRSHLQRIQAVMMQTAN